MSLRLVQETCIDTNDPLVFTKAELDRFDTKLLRRLAAEARSDEIHGKCTTLEIVSYFRGQRTLSEYAE